MRNVFSMELSRLKQELGRMASRAQDAISFSVQAMLTGEAALGERAIEAEKQSDASEQEVRAICMRILLEQQPVASDLRMVSGALRVVADMERIGDMGEDIALLLKKARAVELPAFDKHIAAMADCVIRMVAGSTQSFIKQDAQLAREVCGMDDEADALFAQLKADIVDAMIECATRGQRDFAESALSSLMIAKYLERVGDHAENIAQAALSLTSGS